VEALAAFRRRARETPPAELFTYSAATPTRVALLLAGFYVGAGVSVAGKAETTAASPSPAGLRSPLGARWLARWKRSSAFRPELDREILAHPQFAQANTASNPSR